MTDIARALTAMILQKCIGGREGRRAPTPCRGAGAATASGPTAPKAPERATMLSPEMVELVEELTEAHFDTIEMLAELPSNPDLASHIAYLQSLQRHARGMLAASCEPYDATARCAHQWATRPNHDW
jgi:hypothetical protein